MVRNGETIYIVFGAENCYGKTLIVVVDAIEIFGGERKIREEKTQRITIENDGKQKIATVINKKSSLETEFEFGVNDFPSRSRPIKVY